MAPGRATQVILDLPEHPATLPVDVLLGQCDVTHSRASGPGGQHRNKVQTAVTLTHRLTSVQGSASERRSQAQNLAMAARRLRMNLAIRCRTVPELICDGQGRLQSPMARRWRERVIKGQVKLNVDHEDYPALVAWLLDVLVSLKLDVPATAQLLETSASQLVKVLRKEPAVLVMFNQARQNAGLGVMK